MIRLNRANTPAPVLSKGLFGGEGLDATSYFAGAFIAAKGPDRRLLECIRISASSQFSEDFQVGLSRKVYSRGRRRVLGWLRSQAPEYFGKGAAEFAKIGDVRDRKDIALPFPLRILLVDYLGHKSEHDDLPEVQQEVLIDPAGEWNNFGVYGLMPRNKAPEIDSVLN